MEILNTYFRIAVSAYNQQNTVEQYLEKYNTVLKAEKEIKAELKTKTVKVLRNINHQMGTYTDSRDKKADLINKVFESLTDYFLLSRTVSYVWGEKTHEQAKSEIILNTTQQELDKHYNEIAAKKEEREKACSNPETLEEFEKFIRIKGKDALTPEQVVMFEKLKADRTIERQQKADQEKKQKQESYKKKFTSNNDVSLELHETKHSKTGADIFTVVMVDRVEKSVYYELNSKAKQLGGYYSRYQDLNATPPVKAGFNFNDKEQALQFIENETTTPQPEEKNEEKKTSVSDKLREQANKMTEKANESLNQDRKTNTYRQINQAASAEQKAENEIIFAQKLTAIANGLESGTVKYLYKLSTAAQLEQLERIISRGYYLRTKSMDMIQRQSEEKNPLKDINSIEFPFPTYGVNVIRSIFLKYENTSGMKQDVKSLISYAKRNSTTNDLIIFNNETYIEKLKKCALKISDKWDKDRILDEIKDYERIIKMGLVDLPTLKTALRELVELTEGAGEKTEEEKKQQEIKELERSIKTKKIEGFFPTTTPLINRMLSMAKIQENETILEPSAGLGHIAEEIKNRYPKNDLSLIEWNYNLCEVLNKKGFDVENENFLATSHMYDVILMNPPFERKQDIDHVTHAFNLLKEGGRLVAIMAGNKNNQDKKTRDFMELVHNNGYIVENEENSFKNAFNSTCVNTVTVYLEK